MKLNIQLFNDGTQTVNTSQLSSLATQIEEVVASLGDWWAEFKKDVNDVDSQEGFSTDSGSSYSQSVSAVEGEINELIDVVANLGKNLVTTVSTYEDINSQVTTAIDDWSLTFKNAIQSVIGGLNSTAAKGSYPLGTYLSDMSQSTRNIVNEVSGMVQKTGNAYASLTGQSVVGTVKTVFDWVTTKGASIASSFVNSIFG